jgi:hypothetical protein
MKIEGQTYIKAFLESSAMNIQELHRKPVLSSHKHLSLFDFKTTDYFAMESAKLSAEFKLGFYETF